MQVCKSGRLASTVTLAEVLALQVSASDRVSSEGCARYVPCSCIDLSACTPRLSKPACPGVDLLCLQHLPIELAAAEVGVCVTTFKKASGRAEGGVEPLVSPRLPCAVFFTSKALLPPVAAIVDCVPGLSLAHAVT